MKRFHILCLSLLAFALAMAVGSSDSHVIKKDSIQTYQRGDLTLSGCTFNFAIELPAPLIVDAPYLGRAASNYIMVSEKLADVFVMHARPPPERSHKSELKGLEPKNPCT